MRARERNFEQHTGVDAVGYRNAVQGGLPFLWHAKTASTSRARLGLPKVPITCDFLQHLPHPLVCILLGEIALCNKFLQELSVLSHLPLSCPLCTFLLLLQIPQCFPFDWRQTPACIVWMKCPVRCRPLDSSEYAIFAQTFKPLFLNLPDTLTGYALILGNLLQREAAEIVLPDDSLLPIWEG